jgi:hypothetical protein
MAKEGVAYFFLILKNILAVVLKTLCRKSYIEIDLKRVRSGRPTPDLRIDQGHAIFEPPVEIAAAPHALLTPSQLFEKPFEFGAHQNLRSISNGIGRRIG